MRGSVCVGFAGDEQGARHEGCWVCQGLRSVMGAPARVSRAELNALRCAVYGFPVRSWYGAFNCLVDARFRVEWSKGLEG